MKPILSLILILGSPTLLPAAVGVNHMVVSFPGFNEFLVSQTFDKSEYTGFDFDYISSTTYNYTGSLLDEGLDLYRVNLGNREFQEQTQRCERGSLVKF